MEYINHILVLRFLIELNSIIFVLSPFHTKIYSRRKLFFLIFSLSSAALCLSRFLSFFSYPSNPAHLHTINSISLLNHANFFVLVLALVLARCSFLQIHLDAFPFVSHQMQFLSF